MNLNSRLLLKIALPCMLSFHCMADSLDFWTNRASGVTQNLSGIAYGNQEYVCVGQAGTILTSTNGSEWRIVPSGVTNDLNAVAFDKGHFYVVGTAGLILRASDSSNWQAQISPTTNRLNGISPCDSSLLVLGDKGDLLTSSDGLTWIPQSSGTSRNLQGAAFGNGFTLAVGRGNSNPGTLLVSTDTTNWLDRSSPNLGVAFYAVAFGKGVFVAMDARGVGYTTQDGSHYASHSTGNSDYIFGITFAQNIFVGVGGPFSGGAQKIVTSANGVDWKARPILSTNSAALRAVAYGNGYFMAVGDKGLIVQSAPVASLRLGSVSGSGGGVSLDLDGEIGRAYRIESSTNLLDWSQVLAVTNTTEVMPVLDTQADKALGFYRVSGP